MHFYRLTPDNRILVGGGPGFVPFGGRMHHDAYPKAPGSTWSDFIATTFPALHGIRITHRWGGGFSVTSNSTPQIGTLHDGARGLFHRLHRTRRCHDAHERPHHPRPRARAEDAS